MAPFPLSPWPASLSLSSAHVVFAIRTTKIPVPVHSRLVLTILTIWNEDWYGNVVLLLTFSVFFLLQKVIYSLLLSKGISARLLSLKADLKQQQGSWWKALLLLVLPFRLPTFRVWDSKNQSSEEGISESLTPSLSVSVSLCPVVGQLLKGLMMARTLVCFAWRAKQ